MTEWVMRDWRLKFVSLMLAVGLWTYAMSEEGVEIKRSIPLEIKVQDPHMSILERSTKSLQVTLVAPRSLLSDMTSEQVVAVHKVDDNIKTAGEYSFRIEADEIKLPDPQIHVTRIEPELIQVTLDELIVKKLPVKPNFIGDPAFGYKVVNDEVQLDPNAVLVEGPKGELEKLDNVLTEPIDLVGRIRSFRRTLSIRLPENIKATSEALIDTYIPIREEFEEKSFKDIPFKVLRSSEREDTVTVIPNKVSFVIKGSKRQLDKMTLENTLVYLDSSKLEFGDHEVPVTVVLPEDVSLKDTPPVVKLTLKKK